VHYRAHGLTIASNRPISELVEAEAWVTPDISLQFGQLPDGLGEPSPWFESSYRTAAGQPELVATRRGGGRWLQFAYPDGATFLIDARATSVWVNWPASLTIAGTTEYLLGPILGIALRLRGVVCLHASAVTIGERAYAFAGPAGAGKSTMAATFAGAGFPVLSDDTIALTARDASWFVAPAYPRVRLWPDALSALEIDASCVEPPGEAGGDRHHFDLAAGGVFARGLVPLAGIYLIEFDDGLPRPRIDIVSPAEGLPVLAANTFASRVLDRDGRRREFETLADVLATVPVRRLARAPNLAELADVRALILDDVATGRWVSPAGSIAGAPA
jgi:hypothetical protein